MTPRRPYRTLLLFALAVMALYIAVPTRSYYWDGVGFALVVEHPEQWNNALIETDHLIYLPFGRAAYVFAHELGLEMRSLETLQAVNSIAAACCIFAVGGMVLDWTGSLFIALLASGLLAFSATWWKFATDSDAYILPTLFLVLAFRFILPWQPLRPMSVAALHAAAMLFHELAVLFFPVAVFGVWMQAQGRVKRWLAVLTYAGAAFVMTIAPYMFTASRAGELTVARFPSWLAYHTPDSHFSFGAANAARVAESHVKLLLGGRWTMARRFQGWPTGAALALLAVFTVLIARRPALTTDDAAPNWRDTRSVLLLSVVWIAPFFLFLCFWLPQNAFYRLLYEPALILLVTATALQRNWLFAPEPRKAIAIGVAAVAVWNFCLFIYPSSQTEANPVLVAANQLHGRLRQDAMVYHATLPADDWLILYQNPQTRWMELSRFDPEKLEHDVAEAAGQGRDVWLDGSALEMVNRQPGGPEWLERHTQQKYELKRSGHDVEFAQVRP